jgi:hypothetical protein
LEFMTRRNSIRGLHGFSVSETGDGFSRVLALALCCALGLSAPGFSQQTPARPKKVLTPEQQVFQQEMRAVGAKRDVLRAQAKQAFDAEISRQKAGDCPDANNTYQINVCLGNAVAVTDQNLKTYEGAIRDLLGLKNPDFAAPQSLPGPAAAKSTPDESAAEFDRVERLWHSYLDAVRAATFHQFDGGTGGPSFEMQSHLLLVRSHMLELNTIYDGLLRR